MQDAVCVHVTLSGRPALQLVHSNSPLRMDYFCHNGGFLLRTRLAFESYPRPSPNRHTTIDANVLAVDPLTLIACQEHYHTCHLFRLPESSSRGQVALPSHDLVGLSDEIRVRSIQAWRHGVDGDCSFSQVFGENARHLLNRALCSHVEEVVWHYHAEIGQRAREEHYPAAIWNVFGGLLDEEEWTFDIGLEESVKILFFGARQISVLPKQASVEHENVDFAEPSQGLFC